jgi:hypothetical protein
MTMSLTKSAMRELMKYVDRTCRGLSRDCREEIAQEAVAVALERGEVSSDATLLDCAKAAVPALRKAEQNRRRRGGSIKQRDDAAAETLLPLRRTKARPHVLKGLMPMEDVTAQRLVPVTLGEVPDRTMTAAARRLFIDVIEAVALGHPATPNQLRVVRKAYVSLFGEEPELAWASILADEIQKARRGLLERKHAVASPSPQGPSEFDWSVSVTKKVGRKGVYPELPTKAELPLVPVKSYSRRGQVTVEAEAHHNGKPVTTFFVVGTFGEVPPLVLGVTPAEHAAGVLVRAAEHIARIGCDPVPEYALDLDLVALLIERAGFDGGGGRNGTLSRGGLFRLLVDPAALAKEVETFGLRNAERLRDDEAEIAEARYRTMAARVRTRAGVTVTAEARRA